MSSTKIIAIVLIIAGVLGLAYGKFSYTKDTHEAKVGPVEFSVKDKETGIRGYPQPTGVIELLEARGFAADNATAKFHGNIHFEEYW